MVLNAFRFEKTNNNNAQLFLRMQKLLMIMVINQTSPVNQTMEVTNQRPTKWIH